jgi:hypothetical protein
MDRWVVNVDRVEGYLYVDMRFIFSIRTAVPVNSAHIII